MSSGGSKRQSTTTNQTTNIRDTTSAISDNRMSEGDGDIEGNLTLSNLDNVGNIDASRVTNNVVTDMGALDRAFDVADASISGMGNSVDSALGFGGDALDSAFEFGESAMDSVQDVADSSISASNEANAKMLTATRSEGAESLNNVIKYGVIGIVAIGGIYLITRGRG